MSKFVQNLNIPVPMDWILWLMHSWSEFPHDILHTGNLKRGLNHLPEQGFPSSRSHLHVVEEWLRDVKSSKPNSENEKKTHFGLNYLEIPEPCHKRLKK